MQPVPAGYFGADFLMHWYGLLICQMQSEIGVQLYGSIVLGDAEQPCGEICYIPVRTAAEAVIVILIDFQTRRIVRMKRAGGEFCTVDLQTVESCRIRHRDAASQRIVNIVQHHHPFRCSCERDFLFLRRSAARIGEIRAVRHLPLSPISSIPGDFFHEDSRFSIFSMFYTNRSICHCAKSRIFTKSVRELKKESVL